MTKTIEQVVSEFREKLKELDDKYEPHNRTFQYYHERDALTRKYQAELDLAQAKGTKSMERTK